MGVGISYVYLEHNPRSEEFDREIHLHSSIPEEDCLLSCEIRQVGTNEDWFDDFEIPKSGFYKVEYEWDVDDERDGPYILYAYSYVVGILSLTPSYKARWIYYRNDILLPILQSVIDIFKPVWAVEYCYGGWGLASTNHYLPKAVWTRFFAYKKDPSYSPGVKVSIRSKY